MRSRESTRGASVVPGATGEPTVAFREPTEKAFMEAVIQYLRLRSWIVYHTHDSRRSAPGFPDICAVRGPRLAFIECKVGRGKPTPAQHEWLAALAAVPGVVVMVAYPTQEWWQEIERIFK